MDIIRILCKFNQVFPRELYLDHWCSYSILMISSMASHPIWNFLQMICILYQTINTQQDQLLLQHNLNLIVRWTQTWLMQLNTSKCIILTCSRLTSSSTFNYSCYHKSLPTVCHPTPLFGNSLWLKNVLFTTYQSNYLLNFVKHNFYRCSAETKCLAYISKVWPLLGYGSAVWDPYLQKDMQSIEMVQQRAAHWANQITDITQQCYIYVRRSTIAITSTPMICD